MSQLATHLLGASMLVVLLQLTVNSAEPVVKFIPPDSLTVRTIFVAGCSIENFVPANVTDKEYRVKFDFIFRKPNPSDTAIPLAIYTVVVGDPDYVYFTDMIVVPIYEISVAQGDVHQFPNFELKVNPRGGQARGKYRCSIVVKEGDFEYEYKSNVWNGSHSVIPSSAVGLLTFLVLIVVLKFA